MVDRVVKPLYNIHIALTKRISKMLYRVLIAVGGDRGRTAWVQIYADYATDVIPLAEAQYGRGNVINYVNA